MIAKWKKSRIRLRRHFEGSIHMRFGTIFFFNQDKNHILKSVKYNLKFDIDSGVHVNNFFIGATSL